MEPLNPQERELVQILRDGAIAQATEAGIVTIISVDDLPPEVRECIRAARARDLAHEQECPSCLELEADRMLMDADLYEARGHSKAALALTVQATELYAKAARLRGR